MENKQVFDHQFQGRFLFRIGRVNYCRAQIPLDAHNHQECTEFVFMIRGCQTYQVGPKRYSVSGGEVFTVFPWEVHSTGGMPEEKAVFYYLIVDLKALCEKYTVCMDGDRMEFQKALSSPRKRILKAPKWYVDSCSRIFGLLEKDTFCQDTKIRNLLSELLIDLAEGTENTSAEKNYALEKTLNYIEKHIKEPLEMKGLAEISGHSVSRFQKEFREATGIPPREYILRRKIELCQDELKHSAKTFTEIAYEYGFSSSQYFSTVFRRFCCITPSQYRQQFKDKESIRRGVIYDQSGKLFCSNVPSKTGENPFLSSVM